MFTFNQVVFTLWLRLTLHLKKQQHNLEFHTWFVFTIIIFLVLFLSVLMKMWLNWPKTTSRAVTEQTWRCNDTENQTYKNQQSFKNSKPAYKNIQTQPSQKVKTFNFYIGFFDRKCQNISEGMQNVQEVTCQVSSSTKVLLCSFPGTLKYVFYTVWYERKVKNNSLRLP